MATNQSTNTCSIEGCQSPANCRGWCVAHYLRWRRHGDPLGGQLRGSLMDRFWRKVNKDGPTPECCPELGPCWVWVGSTLPDGYGTFRGGPDGKVLRAPRFAYEQLVGPIPDGLTIDHLCRNPACVNPAHLEAVPGKTNTLRGFNPAAQNARKTHCVHGHEFTPENTKAWDGGRYCRACHKKKSLEHYHRKKGS